MREIVEFDAQSHACPIIENGAAARYVEEAQGLLRHELRRQRQSPPPLERHGAALVRKQSAGRDDRDFGTLCTIENEGMLRVGAGQRPAKARMEPERIGHGLDPEIGRLQRPDERVFSQSVDRIQPEFERIRLTRFNVCLQTQSGEIGALLHQPEIAPRRKTVQSQRVSLAPMPDFAIARPADDRKQDRRRLRPNGRIWRPQEIDAADRPGERLRAPCGEPQTRRAAGKKNVAQR